MARDFRKLKAWERAHALVLEIYERVPGFRRRRDSDLSCNLAGPRRRFPRILPMAAAGRHRAS